MVDLQTQRGAMPPTRLVGRTKYHRAENKRRPHRNKLAQQPRDVPICLSLPDGDIDFSIFRDLADHHLRVSYGHPPKKLQEIHELDKASVAATAPPMCTATEPIWQEGALGSMPRIRVPLSAPITNAS